MMHFFFSYDQATYRNGVLNRLLEMFISVEDENQKLKIIYDMSDIICDKRFEGNDQELRNFVQKFPEDERVKEFLDEPTLSRDQKEYLRIRALKMLWNYSGGNSSLASQKSRIRGEEEQVLHHLVRGNICLRISQCYYENYDLKKSDIWGDKAIEILWHGKNLTARLKSQESENKRQQFELYLRLIKLNLAKYYRDYARKNRRSDFDAALDEFKQVGKRIEEIEFQKIKDRDIKRQYALIWTDAIFNIANIHRRTLSVNIVKGEVKYCYNCLKNSRGLFKELVMKVDELISNDDGSVTRLPDNSMDFAELRLEFSEKCEAMNEYDRKRYFLLILLELSRIYRDLHGIENYKRAMFMAVIVDQWSLKMDRRGDYTPGHNIDALITLSSSLRKYFTYREKNDCKEPMLQRIDILIGATKNSLYLRDEQGNRENQAASLNSFVKKLKGFAKNGHLKSKTEVIKWHCLYLQNPKLLNSIKDEVGKYEDIKLFLDTKEWNLQLRFLKGLVFLRSHQYKRAIKVFNNLISPIHKETQYIRRGTIGLKARYLLANCFMSQAEFSKAEKILKTLQETLVSVKKSQRQVGVNETYFLEDERIAIDLGYCYMQRGEYQKAIAIYEVLFGSGEEGSEFRSLQIKKKHLIMGLNNYAACCIFSINNQTRVRAEKLFKYIDMMRERGILPESDPETSLLKGYYEILMSDTISEKEVLIKAHKHFKEACQFEDGFTPRYNLLNEKGSGNKARYRNEVERISAYLINLTKLYKIYLEEQNTESYEKVKEYELHLERFLLNIPTTYKISLKATIALAEWLLEYEKKHKHPLTDQLYRSFSYITIYEERGAQVFNNLKENSNFRFFTAEKRGKFLALLLKMYKPIKAIKEECCFNLDDRLDTKNLVHYTSIETLKNLFGEHQTDCKKKTSAKKTEPRFRINNCGYMNDVFEGKIFLKSISLIDKKDKKIETLEQLGYSSLVTKYFPQLGRSHENMQPSGSDVYIGSLSVKKDSFPMWSLYAVNESGCNIEFGDDFFDIDGNPCLPKALRDYMISKYTDQDYPLYTVQYIDPKSFEEELQKWKDNQRKDNKQDNKQEDNERCYQHCGTRSIPYENLFQLLDQVRKRWETLEKYLKKAAPTDSASSTTVRSFAADRINEIRFLFKDVDYEFEGEVRVIYTDFADQSTAKIDDTLKSPRIYVNIERDIEDLTVRLGSRIEDATVDEYVTWLMHTKRVKKVELARRNRYTT